MTGHETLLPPPDYQGPWSVPHAEYHHLAPRRTRYCVVIPVINEGTRVQSQLSAMHASGLTKQVDVIMADGGSSDGSMDTEFLRSVGVRALLIKRDVGKLSAQLRMGYAFALTEGYEGIVTVDGNGKDSIASIPLFLDALDQGADYAQGSRFIPGGRAVNTPLSRHLAIHFIHAPLISLGARRRLTDTTNGFRAYSRRYLLHPAVQPFRPVFDTYELLAFLSCRASRIGLKVTEVPVARCYPDKGPTPTKISPLRGNLLLMKILFRLLAGRYDPAQGSEP